MQATRSPLLISLLLLALCALAKTSYAADPGAVVFTKTGPATAVAGAEMTYQIDLINGAQVSVSTTLSDALPPGTVFISVAAVPAINWNCAGPPVGSPGTVTCQRAGGPLGAGEEATFTIVVRVCAETPCNTVLVNQASLSAFDPPVTLMSNQVMTRIDSQADVGVTKTGPAMAAAGSNIAYTLEVANHGLSSSFGTTLTDLLPAGWTVVSADTTVGNCAGAGTGMLNCSLGTLGAPGVCAASAPQSATITVVAHIPSVSPPGAVTNTATVANTNCLADPTPSNNTATFETTVTVPILGPGQFYPPTSEISGTKAGSVLFFNFYVSDPANPASSNSRISITNTNPNQGVAVHLFFVDGATCTVADRFICLTPNQTFSFLMSNIDPGTSGYLIAVAVDGPPGFAEGGNTGCPISFNYLIGQASVKLASSPRRQDELEAEGCASEFGSPVPGCTPGSTTATLVFNGSPNGYNRLPRVLALDNIVSRADGNDTLLIVNRIGGDLTTGGTPLGSLFGVLYDDAERAHSFSFSSSACQFRASLTNGFPRTSPPFESVIPAGRSGWMKFWTVDEGAILGAAINRNDNKETSANAFEGGHNLHKLRFTPTVTLTIPVFPPSC